MDKAKQGDNVKVHFKGKLEDGKVFVDSNDKEPLEFEIGGGKIIEGIENGIIGMEPGDKKDVEIMSEEGFGDRRDELVIEVMKTDLPENIAPRMGQELQVKQENGEPINFVVTDMKEDSIILDANHPLAGHTLFFELELVQII